MPDRALNNFSNQFLKANKITKSKSYRFFLASFYCTNFAEKKKKISKKKLNVPHLLSICSKFLF